MDHMTTPWVDRRPLTGSPSPVAGRTKALDEFLLAQPQPEVGDLRRVGKGAPAGRAGAEVVRCAVWCVESVESVDCVGFQKGRMEKWSQSGGKIWGVAFAFGWMKTCEFVEHPPPCRTSG